MRHGRTSLISFVSALAMSVAGFVATVFLTNTLWRAVQKRVSESTPGNYVVAGAVIQVALYSLVAAGLLLGQPYLNRYLEFEATTAIVAMLAAHLAIKFLQAVLDGQGLVHVSSLLTPVEWITRSVVQIALVAAGLGIVGAFVGYVVGAVVASLVAIRYVSSRLELPSLDDVERLRTYAQFSWLAPVSGRAFLSMDTIVLALFVTNSVVAVYEVAWNLASLFATFSKSVGRALFPDMSQLSSVGDDARVGRLLDSGVMYSGLFTVPGLVGAALVGDTVLTIYGPGFDQGAGILVVLTLARLLYGYSGQFLNAIDALDRPEVTFRIYAVFVVTNLVLNVLLIWQFGWYGAAAATAVSAGVSLILSYRSVSSVLDFSIPVAEMAKQWVAAVVMAAVVLAGQSVFGDSLLVVVPLIAVGAGVYFLALLGLSAEVRTTVRANLPKLDTVRP